MTTVAVLVEQRDGAVARPTLETLTLARALGTPVVRTDAAGIWATGTAWWQARRQQQKPQHTEIHIHSPTLRESI